MESAAAFKSLLLFDLSLADKIDQILTDIALVYLLPVLIIAVLWELFTSNNILSVGKSLIFSMILLFSFTKIYKATVDYSFGISYEIIKSRGGKNTFIKTWTKLVRANTKNKSSLQGKFNSFVEIIRGSDDFVLSLISVFVLGIFILTSAIYTLGYYLNYIFIGVSALVGIFPITKKVLYAPIKGLMWSAIVPIGCAVVVTLIGSIVDVEINRQGQFIYNLKSYIEIGVLSICIFLILPGVYSFLNGQSFGVIAGSLANKAASSVVHAGVLGGAGYAMTKMSKYSAGSVMAVTKPLRDFSNIAKGAIGSDANRLVSKHSSSSSNNQTKNFPEIFKEKVEKDTAEGVSATKAVLNPSNHLHTIKEKTKSLNHSLRKSPLVSVYKGEKKKNGHVSAIKSAGIITANSILNRKPEVGSVPERKQRDTKHYFEKQNYNQSRIGGRYGKDPRSTRKYRR